MRAQVLASQEGGGGEGIGGVHFKTSQELRGTKVSAVCISTKAKADKFGKKVDAN